MMFVAALLPLNAAKAETKHTPAPKWVSNLSETLTEQIKDKEAAERQEITCVALAVYYESRGEIVQGQRAVASVVMNRSKNPRFPSSACGVLFQRSQFSFLNRGRVLRPTGALWDRAVGIATETFAKVSHPYLFFSGYLPRGVRIGNHIFRQ